MFTICRQRCVANIVKNFLNTSNQSYSNCPQSLSCPVLNHNLQIFRYKSKKPQKPAVSASESESGDSRSFEDEIVDKNTKIMNISVKSARIDGILKSGLGIARNKIETYFYESKIRVNGKKLLKKGESAQEGDEIDIVKGPSGTNPNFLTVARVEVLGIVEKTENVAIKIRRCKNLTVEKYDDDDCSS